MKGQTSVESLLIVGFAILLFIPILMFIYLQSSSASNSVNIMEVNAALSQLSTSASLINSGSEDSAIFAKVTIPATVKYVDSRQLCKGDKCITEFVAHFYDGTEMTQVTAGKADIKGNAQLGAGIYYLKVQAVLEGAAPNQAKVAQVSIYG
jgi:hypothetical protein